MTDDKALSLLRKLGFTIDEIIVYVALSSSTGLTAAEVSSASKVPTNRVYNIMENLQKKGFIEIWPGKPTFFYAIPLENALGNYMYAKEMELKKELKMEPRDRTEPPPKVTLLKKGSSYIVKEEKPETSFDIFKNALYDGVDGLCITRLPPEKVKEKYSITSNVFWLTNQESADGNTLRVQRPDEIVKTVRNFVEKNKNGVVLLDGLEYLISRYEFPKALKLIHDLNEVIAVSDSRLIVPLDPRTLDGKEMALLERDMEIFGT
jgi:predicted transcriptional regulator